MALIYAVSKNSDIRRYKSSKRWYKLEMSKVFTIFCVFIPIVNMKYEKSTYYIFSFNFFVNENGYSR